MHLSPAGRTVMTLNTNRSNGRIVILASLHAMNEYRLNEDYNYYAWILQGYYMEDMN